MRPRERCVLLLLLTIEGLKWDLLLLGRENG